MEGKQEQIGRYLEELIRWGGRMNLVGSTDRDALQVHVQDSLAASSALPRDARVVDLGSGAGFPGVPLAIARPDLSMVLVEIREARVHFLRHVVRTLDLGCEVRRCRIEEAPTSEQFDFVVARAVGPLADVLAGSLGWLRPHGETWVWTRTRGDEAGLVESSTIEIDPPSGARGHILRVPARAIPRGTLTD